MKRMITIAVGIGIFVAAGAIGRSDSVSKTNDLVLGASEFGLVSVENLTTDQRTMLQSKFQYWTSSNAVMPKAPR